MIGYIILLLLDLFWWTATVYIFYYSIRFQRSEGKDFVITELEEETIYRSGNCYRIKGYFSDDPDRQILTSLDVKPCSLQQKHAPGMTITAHRVSTSKVMISNADFMESGTVFFLGALLSLLLTIAHCLDIV